MLGQLLSFTKAGSGGFIRGKFREGLIEGVGKGHCGRDSISIASIKEMFILGEDWALGYSSMEFWDFPDVS